MKEKLMDTKGERSEPSVEDSGKAAPQTRSPRQPERLGRADTDIAIQVLRLHRDRVDAREDPLYYETLCGIIDFLDGQQRELEAYRSALPLGDENISAPYDGWNKVVIDDREIKENIARQTPEDDLDARIRNTICPERRVRE